MITIKLGTSRSKRRSWRERGGRKYGASRKNCKLQFQTVITKEQTRATDKIKFNYYRVYREILERRENPEVMVDQEEEDYQAKK